jgi:hypothetical protein
MRQYWSMRLKKRQHSAQTLRFVPPPKKGIIRGIATNGPHSRSVVGNSKPGLVGTKAAIGINPVYRIYCGLIAAEKESS